MRSALVLIALASPALAVLFASHPRANLEY